jgi:hypothetical protein
VGLIVPPTLKKNKMAELFVGLFVLVLLGIVIYCSIDMFKQTGRIKDTEE